jgi:hypothetical protein
MASSSGGNYSIGPNIQTPWPLARKRNIPTEDRRWSANFLVLLRIDGCRMVSAAVPHSR